MTKAFATNDGLRLLLISSSDYQSAVAKGVAPMLAEFDEDGFFQSVLIAFPFARTTCDAKVSERVVVRDIGTDWVPFSGRWRWLRRAAAPFHLVWISAALISAVTRERITLVRATDPSFSGIVGWLTARVTGRPFCVSVHADFDKRYDLGGASAGVTIFGSRTLARAIEGFVLRRADMVLPIRDSLRAYALTLGVKEGRIRVIPHGTDLRPFVEPSPINAAAGYNVSSDKKIVSFVGRLVRENYIDDVLDLARRLGEVRDDFRLVIIGGGPEESRTRAVVESDAILRRVVRLAGFRPRGDVAALRQASSVSLCLMGGFSLIEACAAASPVVSYDVEWHRELVKDSETGFLVPEHDVTKLVDVVTRLLDDPAMAVSLGRNARAIALSRHDLDATIAIKRRCYQELLAGVGQAS